MNTENGLWLAEVDEMIYSSTTPLILEYPVGVQVAWKEFEEKLRDSLHRFSDLHTVMMLMSDSVIANSEIDGIDARFFALEPTARIPHSWYYDDQDNPGYKTLCNASEFSWWQGFHENLGRIDQGYSSRTKPYDDRDWPVMIETMYAVACMRALRESIPDARTIFAIHGELDNEILEREKAFAQNQDEQGDPGKPDHAAS